MAQVRSELGLVLQEGNFRVVKKALKAGEHIQSHNHPEANILFTLVKGRVQAFINDDQTFDLEPGKLLSFDGDNYIKANILEDSEIFITLINK